MINLAELKKGPLEPEELLTLTKDQVRRTLVKNIEKALAITSKIRGAFESEADATKTVGIFEMDANNELSEVYSVEDPRKAGVMEKGQFQDVAFETMTEYGLDVNLFSPLYTWGGWDSHGASRHRDGTSREILVFPSQTHPRLHFQRSRNFYTGTDETISVSWSAEGRKLPFRSKIINLFRHQPTKEAS